jgi:hypothetical protein
MDYQNQAVLVFPLESRPSWILLLCRRPHENVLAAWCCCLSWLSAHPGAFFKVGVPVPL